MPQTRPTREQLLAVYGRSLPDVIRPGLDVLFCGINPSLYSAAVGHHFARPGNRFWPALHAGGFTERRYAPSEDHLLLKKGYGLSNLVDRATARADELTLDEMRDGARTLERKVRRLRPRYVALLGISVYPTAFGWTDAALGEQPILLGESKVWILPSPSGLNAHYQPAALANLFREFRRAVENTGR
jgi:TDG/mug DNA glycosylase family protein